MAQPGRGLLASAVIIVIALVFISRVDAATFAGPLAFFMLCLIPTQIVMAVIWRATPPVGHALPQPARGALLLALNLAAAAVIAPLCLRLVGEGLTPPGPIPSHFAIIVVPTTFFLAIAFGGWPFTTLVRSPVAAGLLLLAASYALTFAIFRLAFDYGFLAGAPVYLASAPHGLFNAVDALVYDVTALAVMFLLLCFDLWPLTRWRGVMQQPWLGLAWTALSLAGGGVVFFVGVGLLGVDPMVFLTRVTAPFIFGCILVLNMLENTLFAGVAPPLKGLLNAGTALAAGIALASVYGVLAPWVSGPLPSGAPAYDFEIWLANALLSVTFPFLIYHAAYVGFWPLAGHAAPRAEETART